jgi:hypothetical protein
MPTDDELLRKFPNATVIRKPLELGVGYEPGRVWVKFNQPITLLGLLPEKARALAAGLLSMAAKALEPPPSSLLSEPDDEEESNGD